MVACGVVATAPPLYADFSYTVSLDSVQFTDQSSGYNLVRWQWTFGDGSSSENQDPAHTYDAVGSYTVTLKVTDVDDVYTSSTQIVVISEVPLAHVDLTIVALAMIVLGIIAVAISHSNYTRIGAAVVVVAGLIVWVMGSG
jgi:PKD repeat protein